MFISSAKMSLLVTSLLLLLASLSSFAAALPGGVVPQHGILTTSRNPFEGGRVGSCEIPTITGVCDGLVDYPVPTSIARLAPILEDTIMNTIEPFEEDCKQTYREIQCRLRFPRCMQPLDGSQSEYRLVDLNRQNCSDLLTACPTRTGRTLQSVCNGLVQKTVPSAGCTPLSQRDYQFRSCSFPNPGDILVTDWMFHLMQFEDQRAGGNLYNHEPCGEGLASFMCNSIGRCTSDGNEVTYVNTHESCNQAVGCYSDDDQVHAQREVSCPLWPQEHLQNQPSSAVVPIDTIDRTDPIPDNGGGFDLDSFFDQFSSGLRVKHCILWITVAALFSLLL